MDGVENSQELYRDRESLSTRDSRKIKRTIKLKDPQIILHSQNVSFKESNARKNVGERFRRAQG